MKNRKSLSIVLALSVLLVLLIGAVIFLAQGMGFAAPKIGVCFRQLADDASQEYRSRLESLFNYSGYKIVVSDARNDQSKQDSQIAKMLKDGCDLLVVEPVITSAADAVVAQVKKADVPLIFINREPTQQILDSWEKLSYVGCDTANAGTVQGQIALKLPQKGDINGDGVISYVILQADPGLIDTQLRTQSCITAMTEAGAVVSCLETVSTDGTKENSQLRCASLLAKYGKDIELILCSADNVALGALDAIKEGGWNPGTDVYLLGIGGSAAAVELVQQQQLAGTVARDTAGLCDRVLTIATQMLAGSNVQRINHVEFLAVTPPETAETQ